MVGIFDPTGIADITNAVLYFGRGEILFGMLSLVSVIPYLGDAIAKPIITTTKTTKSRAKWYVNDTRIRIHEKNGTNR